MFRWKVIIATALLATAPFVHAGPGKDFYEELQKQEGILDDPEWKAYVQAIGERLIAASPNPKLKVQFYVADSASVNANAWPDGYIFIYRGLLAFMESEDQLASVIGHEIGHILARHYQERVGRSRLGGAAGWVAYLLTGVGELKSTADAATAVMVSGFGREQELEADQIGGQLLAKAGYNPFAMIEMLQVLKDQETFEKSISGGRQTYHGLFASHPKNDKRLHDAVELSYRYQNQVVEPIADYWARLDGLVYGDEAAAGIVKDGTFYHSSLRFVVTFPDGWVVANNPSNVRARAPGGTSQGLISLERQEQVKGQDPEEYVEKTLKRDDVVSGEAIDVNGFKAYVAKVKGDKEGDTAMIAVVFKDGGVYYFKGKAEAGADGAAFEQDFRATVASFRGMVKDDLKIANKQRIKVVEAVPGDTYRSLAQRSSLQHNAEETLRLLNGDYPLAEPRPGDLIKIVQ